jgi:hypothetical protein
MTQAILVQEAAIKSLDEQNKQLTAQIQQLQAELQRPRRRQRRRRQAVAAFCRASLAAAPATCSRRPERTGLDRRLA